MRAHTAFLSGLLLVGHAADVSAKSFPDHLIHAVRRRAASYEDVMLRQAHGLLHNLEARQTGATGSSNTISTTPQSGGNTSEIDTAAWNSQTKAACDAAMVPLAMQVSNPVGMAVCYNIPFFNNRTGVFEAELRMYNISAPFDPWTDVTAADISMTLSYASATVQATNGSSNSPPTKRDTILSWPPIKMREVDVADNALARRQAPPQGPQELKVLMYVGQVNQDMLDTAKSSLDMQNLLVPTVQLTARSPQTNQPLNTTISATQASFLNGVFSQRSANTTSASGASISNVANAVSFLIPGYRLAPLQVPGLTLPTNLLFPTGLIITLIWTVLFMGVVGWGTYGRIRFRDQYRRRVKRDVAAGVRTI